MKRAATLLKLGFLIVPSLLVLATCTIGAPQSQATPTALVTHGADMDLEGMVQGADAIVIGVVREELEPSGFTHLAFDGDDEITVTDHYRNFLIDVEKSYTPTVADSAIIVVSVQTNRRVAGTADPVTIFDSPEIEVGRSMLIFARQSDWWTVDGQLPPTPAGFGPASHFIVHPNAHESEPFVAGALAQDGDTWVHLPTGAATNPTRVRMAVAEHGDVVPRDCHRITSQGDYMAAGFLELVESTDAVIRGRMGGRVASEHGNLAVEVIDVVLGDVPFEVIQLVGHTLEREPGFATCDYYMFLSKEIDFSTMDMEVPDDWSHIYRLSFGPRSAFAIYDGTVDEGHLFLGDKYRGASVGAFVSTILGLAAEGVR